MKVNIINYLLISTAAIAAACDEPEKPYALGESLISGKLQYIDARTLQGRDVPVDTDIVVMFTSNVDTNMIHYNYSFKTTQAGLFSFRPPAAGKYELSVLKQEQVLQFSKAIVQKFDLDTLRADEFHSITYETTAAFDVGNQKFFHQDLVLEEQSTRLKLTLQDENGNPLPGIRVCLYENKDFAMANSPYCGGSIKYLTSDLDGNAFFTDLEAKEYFVNARGSVGSISLNNTYSEEARTIKALTTQVLNERVTVLK